MQWACNEVGLRIPWAKVAEEMGNGVTEGAIVQHLAKLRQRMVETNMQVPPTLKRGVINAPSVIYATGNKRKVPVQNPVKESRTAGPVGKRNKKTKRNSPKDKFEDDDDGLEGDFDSDSDGEYGVPTTNKKRRNVSSKAKASKQKSVTEYKADDDEELITPKGKTPTFQDSSEITNGRAQSSSDVSLSPMPRTRGVIHDYSKFNQGEESDSEHEIGAAENAQKDKAGDEENRDQEDAPRGISPHTRVAASIANNPSQEVGHTVLDALNRAHSNSSKLLATTASAPSSNAMALDLLQTWTWNQPPGGIHAYPVPVNSNVGIPSQSTTTSFSTDRTSSIGSLPSNMTNVQLSHGNQAPTVSLESMSGFDNSYLGNIGDVALHDPFDVDMFSQQFGGQGSDFDDIFNFW